MSAPPPLAALADGAAARLGDSTRAVATRSAERDGVAIEVLATLDHSPGRLDLFLDFYEQLLSGSGAGPRLKERIRRRVAELAQLREEGRLGQDAEPELPHGLTADERAVVRFMDAFAIDHHAIAPEIFDELREHFPPAELTEIVWAVAIVFALARVGSAIGTPGVR